MPNLADDARNAGTRHLTWKELAAELAKGARAIGGCRLHLDGDKDLRGCPTCKADEALRLFDLKAEADRQRARRRR